MFDPHDFKCNYISKEDIRLKADAFRKQFWDCDILPIDMEAIIEGGLRLDIIPKRSIHDSLEIDAYLQSDLSSIVVDYRQYMDEQNRYVNRLRFTFAHEVGHLILHRYMYNRFNFLTPEDYHDFMSNFPGLQYSRFEFQANEFAGRLLVSRQRLIDEIKRLYEEKMANDKDIQRILRVDPDVVLDYASSLICKHFGVSETVIKYRAKNEELWPPSMI